MFRPSVISLLSTLYLTSLPLIAIITNMYPHMARDTQEVEITNCTVQEDSDKSLRLGMAINQFVIFIIGGLGNLLTLLAIPYVRLKYKVQFSILQLNSVVLILHLSLADLLYTLVGFPHFLQVYFLREGPEDERLCYFLGFFRNLVAYVDFHTIAMISCCVARHKLCRECGGASLRHDDHDKIFGGKRVYLVCLGIWVVSFFALLPDVMGVTGVFAWSCTPYGCDHTCSHEGCSNIGPFLSITNNIIFMVIFYAVIVIKLCRRRNQVYGRETSEFTQMLKSISVTLSVRITAYLAFLIPPLAAGFGRWPTKSSSISYRTKGIIASIYWWMYGINFVIYLVTSSRIRQAYRQFIKDMWKKMCKGSSETLDNVEMDTNVSDDNGDEAHQRSQILLRNHNLQNKF